MPACLHLVNSKGDWPRKYQRNRPISQIPQCIRQMSHNAPFCDRNVHCYKLVRCAILDWCIVGYVQPINIKAGPVVNWIFWRIAIVRIVDTNILQKQTSWKNTHGTIHVALFHELAEYRLTSRVSPSLCQEISRAICPGCTVHTQLLGLARNINTGWRVFAAWSQFIVTNPSGNGAGLCRKSYIT